jgi:predicted CopG family antitoxin
MFQIIKTDKAIYEQGKYYEEILELKKDKNKSFEDVMKSIKRKKQDDYEEETPLKKG